MSSSMWSLKVFRIFQIACYKTANIKIIPCFLEVVVAAYKRWSSMRGYNNRDLTGKILVTEVVLYLQALKDFRRKTTLQ